MKLLKYHSITILLFLSLQIFVFNNDISKKKPLSKATKFVADFISAMGYKKGHKKLIKYLMSDCPKLKKSHFVKNVKKRLFKMVAGLKTLNSKKK